MVHFVALAQAAQDRNGVFNRRLVHQHGLKTPLERRVFFDVPAVFVERRGADAVQFAAREHRLQQVARVHRALGFARAHHRVQLVDKKNDGAFRTLHFFEHSLQALLELAPELGARNQRAHVE